MGKLHEIDKDSIVKATGGGYMYCTTTPPHPYGESRGDRKKKYIYLHRAILENKLGRYLRHDEQADHKNGDKSDNSPYNIVLINLGDHQRSHTERGNHFWKKSPANKKNTTKNKKKKAASMTETAHRIVLTYLKTV